MNFEHFVSSLLSWHCTMSLVIDQISKQKNLEFEKKTRVFTCQQYEYSSSGSDVSVNVVIIPHNCPLEGIVPNLDHIHWYILPRITAFPQYILHKATVFRPDYIPSIIGPSLKSKRLVVGVRLVIIIKMIWREKKSASSLHLLVRKAPLFPALALAFLIHEWDIGY